MGDLTVVFRTPSPIEADVVRGLLESHGIPTMISADISRTPFPLSVNELRVTVNAENADQAQQLIESHRDDSRGGKLVPFGSELEPLERTIGYKFRDRGLLEHALTHRSRVHEDASGGVFDNESMEFLGDSILGFVIADLLFRQFPQHNEGQKSKLRASLVSAASLARLGERINLGEYLILGRGEEKTGGRRKHAIIADCYEALIAAIYLDGGFEPVRAFLRRQFQELIDEASRTGARLHGGLQIRAPGAAAAAGQRPARVPPHRRNRSRPSPPLRSRSPGRRRAARQSRRQEQEGRSPERREARAGSNQIAVISSQ